MTTFSELLEDLEAQLEEEPEGTGQVDSQDIEYEDVPVTE